MIDKFLTKSEIKTLDAAEKIIAAHTPKDATWSFSFHEAGMYSTACYFDSAGTQHMLWTIDTLAAAIEAGIALEAKVPASEEKRKANRVARLKAELAKLGEVA